MDEIRSHTYADGEQAYEVSLRSAALAAEASGLPGAVHRHTASEPCRGGSSACRRVDPDGTISDLYSGPVVAYPVLEPPVLVPSPVRDVDMLMGWGDGRPEGLV